MNRPVLACLVIVLAVVTPRESPAQSSATVVTIQGTKFLINGTVTHPGTSVEGMLLNSRMVQAAFDDENPTTAVNWRYPDTGVWSPDRNTDEFIAALPSYRAKGMRAMTINLEGGSPGLYKGGGQPTITSAFTPDGTLKVAWITRLDRVIKAARANGIVVIVGYFYFGQTHRIKDEAAVIRAVDNATDWLLASDYRNVLVEINNECNVAYSHAILACNRVSELITRVQQRSGGRLLVSASPGGNIDPPDNLIAASDYVLVHGNGQNATGIRDRTLRIKSRPAYQQKPKPIVYNEDSPSIANFDAAVTAGASWGSYDQGKNNYYDGFQSPPVNWTLNTSLKRAFFDRVAYWTGTSGSPPPAQAVTSFTLINADTDLPISGFDPLPDGATLNLAALPTPRLNIRVNTAPSVVGSVQCRLNGQLTSTDSTAPYSCWGDSSGNYAAWTPSLGSHVMAATPFSSASGGGTAGTSLTRQFTVVDDTGALCQPTLSATSSTTFAATGGSGNVSVTIGAACAWTATSNANWITITTGAAVTGPGAVSYGVAAHTGTSSRTGTLTIARQTFTVTQAASTSQAVTSFTLINADTNLPIAGFDPLPDGATLNLATLPTRRLNLRVNTAPAVVGSVQCRLNGQLTLTESTAPYACWGDKNGDYSPWTPPVGSHAITATPFSSSNGGGTAGTSLTRQLTVADDAGEKPPDAPKNVRIVK